MSELLPCPFCGGEASDEGHIRFSTPLHDAWWPGDVPITEAFYVNCVKCGAVSRSGIVGGYQTKAEAIDRWNTRVSTNKDETIANLREALELTSTALHGYIMLTGDNHGTGKDYPVSDASHSLVQGALSANNAARDLLTSTKKEG